MSDAYVYTKKVPEAPPELNPNPGRGWIHWAILTVAFCGIAWAYVFLAQKLLEQTNLVPQKQDQKHNMKRSLLVAQKASSGAETTFAEKLTAWFPQDTDGVVGPLWPWVAALLAHKDHPVSEFEQVTEQDRALFLRGKTLNVTLTGIFLLGLGLMAGRNFSTGGTVLVVLLGAFGALLPRAIFFQPEPLYFIFFTLAWLCAIQLLRKNSVWMHAIFGLICGLAYLAKSSVQPLMICWFLVATFRWICGLCGMRRGGTWSCGNHFIGVLVLSFSFVALTGPQFVFAKKQFGSALHSYPKYWMWMDAFDSPKFSEADLAKYDTNGDKSLTSDEREKRIADMCDKNADGTLTGEELAEARRLRYRELAGYEWMQQHGSEKQLGALSPELTPSFKNYAATHTSTEMIHRLVDGTYEKLEQFFAPKWDTPKEKGKKFGGWKRLLDMRGIYLGACFGLLCYAGFLVLLKRPAQAIPALQTHPESGMVVLFVVGTFVAYSLSYGWYHPIGRGERFMLSLYLPLVYSMIWGAENLVKLSYKRDCAYPWRVAYGIGCWLLVAAVAWRLGTILTEPVFDPAPL